MKGSIIKKIIAAGLCVALPCMSPISYVRDVIAAEYNEQQESIAQDGTVDYIASGDGYAVTKVVSDARSLQLGSSYNGSDVVGIEENAFLQCNSVETVVLPSTLKYIGDYAFAGSTALEQVVIQEGLESIGEGAFEDCSNLVSFTIPKSVVSIGENAFSENTKLYVYENSEGEAYALMHDYDYSIIKNSEKRYTEFRVELPKYEYKVGEALKKDEVVGYGIYEDGSEEIIEDYQLSQDFVFNSTGYKDYTFPYTQNGYNLNATVWIDVTEAVTGTPDENIVTDCAEYTYDNIFEGLELTSWTEDSSSYVTVPESVQGYPVISIDYNAFVSSDHVTSITLPKTIEYIDIGAFEKCTSLKSIHVADGGKYYSEDGVLYSSYIDDEATLVKYPMARTGNSFVLPENVTAISMNGFSGSTYLKQVTLGKNVTRIPMDAFADCKSLTDVYVLGDLTEMSAYAFEDCTNEITIHANGISYDNVISQWLEENTGVVYANIDNDAPTMTPTKRPTMTPTKGATMTPTKRPTMTPTKGATMTPTKRPTATPTKRPAATPTKAPVVKLSKPTLKVKLTSESGVKLSWKKVKNAQGYTIYRSTKKNSGYKKLKKVTNSSTLSYTDTKTKNGTTYYYYVTAYAKSGKKTIQSVKSNLVNRKVVKNLAAPKITSLGGTNLCIKMSWSKVKNATEYEIYMQVGNGKPRCVRRTKKTSIEVAGEDYDYAQTKCIVSVKAVYKKDDAKIESMHSKPWSFKLK